MPLLTVGMAMTSAEFVTFATPILTAIGVFVAAFTVYNNTENAKKRATIDMIMAERNDTVLQNAIARVNELAKQPDLIFSKYVSDDEQDRADRKCILKVLNQREFVSAGVLGGALHENMYKDFAYSMFLRDWENLKGFVYEMRRIRNAPTAFQEFETLARKWKKEPLKVKQ